MSERESSSPPGRIVPFTRVPNSLFDVWMPVLNGAELALLMWVIRGTLGWTGDESGRRSNTRSTSLADISIQTGYSRHAVSGAAKTLSEIGLIGRIGGQGSLPSFSLDTQALYFPDELVQKLDKLRLINMSKNWISNDEHVQKLDMTCPESGHVHVQKLHKLSPAYRNKRNSLKERETTTSADAAADTLTEELKEPRTASAIDAIQKSFTGPKLSGQAIVEIHHELKALSLSWQHAALAWKQNAGGLNQAGGFRQFVRNWATSTISVKWPACLDCEDRGTPDGKFPCDCPAGEPWLKRNPKAAARIAAREGNQPFCEHCGNTGFDQFDLPCSLCELGAGTEARRAGREEKERKGAA